MIQTGLSLSGLTMILLFNMITLSAQENRQGKLIFSDNFEHMDQWIPEVAEPQTSFVYIKDNRLHIDVSGGATVWFKHKIKGNYIIEYSQHVNMKEGRNLRLSDMNQFWNASDPMNRNLFTRSGAFREYDSLQLYYVGFGGNSNTTTRFRRYDGLGNRELIFENNNRLLESNKIYRVRIEYKDGQSRFFINGEEYFSFKDPQPLKEGHFAFRTVRAHQTISDFRVFKMKAGKMEQPAPME